MKSLWGTAKQMSTLKVLIIITTLMAGLMSTGFVFAVIQDNGNPDTMTQDPGINQGVSASREAEIRKLIDKKIREREAEVIKNIYSLFSGFQENSNNNEPSSPSPTSSIPTTLPSPTSSFPQPSYSPQPFTGSVIYYRQCSLENRNAKMVPGCSICDAGCGLASAATIASTLLNDRSYTPIRMLSIYKSSNYYVQCDGTSINNSYDFFKSLPQQGFANIKTTAEYIFRGMEYTYYEAAPFIKPYTDQGWMIVMLARFNNIGHFVVITAVDSQSNFTVYDPYYEPNDPNQPNKNLTRYKTNAVYRAAFAVRRQ